MTVAVPAKPVPAPGGGLDVVYVLSLMQVAFLLLAAVGEMLLMGGNPAFLLMPVLKSVLLVVFAAQAVRRRRWALRALFVLSWITLAGVAIQLLAGLFPVVDYTLNLVGLMTNVGLPVAVIWLCRPHLRAIRQERREARAAARAAALAARTTRMLPVPQDPYAAPTLPIVYPPVVHGAPIPQSPVSPAEVAR